MKYLLLLVLLVSISTVYAADFSYTFNESQGLSRTELVTIRYVENKTLNISYGTYTSGIANQLFFNGTNSSDMDIVIGVPGSTPAGNYTDYVTLSNIADNFTSQISFFFEIIPLNITVVNETNQTNQTNQTNTTPTVDYILIDFNHFEYTICDYALPWNGSKEITVRGRDGQNVYSDYDTNFFSVPVRTTIPAANYSIVNISMHLANLSIGTYSKQVSFSIISNNSNVTFDFNIQSCLRPAPVYDEWVRVCSIINKTAADALQCQKLTAEYNQELYDAMLDTQEDHTVNHTIKEYVNITDRVPVLDLGDPSVVQALKDIPITWKQMIVDQNEKNKKIDALNVEMQSLRQGYTDEIKNLRDESEKRITESLQTLTQDNIVQRNTITMYEENYLKKSTLWTWIIIGILIALSIGGYIWYDSNTFW